MKIAYIGGMPDGRVRDAKGREFTFKNGEAVEVPDDTAAELLALTEPDPTLDNLKNVKHFWKEII